MDFLSDYLSEYHKLYKANRYHKERNEYLEKALAGQREINEAAAVAVQDITEDRDNWFEAYDRLRAEFCALQEKHNMKPDYSDPIVKLSNKQL